MQLSEKVEEEVAAGAEEVSLQISLPSLRSLVQMCENIEFRCKK